MGALGEECGVLAVVGPEYAMDVVVKNLRYIQNRGPQSAGAAGSDEDGDIIVYKGVGLVKDVFKKYPFRMFHGSAAIGGTRYSTVGGDLERDAKPIVRYIKLPTGEKINLSDAYRIEKPIHLEDVLQIAVDHNGNDPFFTEVRDEAEKKGVTFGSENDVEGFVYRQAEYLVEQHNENPYLDIDDEVIFNSIKYAAERWQGSISLVELVNGEVWVYREPKGIKPLVWGYKELDWGKMFMISSESLPLTQEGVELENIFSFPLGYIGVFKDEDVDIKRLFDPDPKYCSFEWAYFANQLSVINGVPVAKFRGDNLSQLIAEDIRSLGKRVDAVTAVPETAELYAFSLAHILGVPYVKLIIRNRDYSKRAFQLLDSERKDAYNLKYLITPFELENIKHLVIVDDSIVRGETLGKLVKKIREMHPELEEIGVYSAFFKITNICPYGIDMQRRSKLIGYDFEKGRERSEEEIAKILGVDWVRYATPDMYEKALVVKSKDGSIQYSISKEHLCLGCSLGQYPLPISEEDLERLAREREEAHSISSNK
ncbi:MAG: hypothetical protein J7K73_01785 [Nanoarchaeota archaeon]|nr:hypothetical protein [Nanoarchaeota archaeon]